MVEVDDQAEWDFLLNFIDTHSGFDGCSYLGSSTQCDVFLGVRDTNTPDKTYHFLHSGQPMSFTVWDDDQPDGLIHDCVVISPFTRKMRDVGCDYDIESRTVCELDAVGNANFRSYSPFTFFTIFFISRLLVNQL